MAGAADSRGEDGLNMSRQRGSKSGGGASLGESPSSGDFGGVRWSSYKMVLSESHAGGDWHKARMFLHDTRMSESHGRWDLDSAGMFSESGARLWIHGHIHAQSDYLIGETRVIANPRGYPREDVGDFQPDLVVEV